MKRVTLSNYLIKCNKLYINSIPSHLSEKQPINLVKWRHLDPGCVLAKAHHDQDYFSV